MSQLVCPRCQGQGFLMSVYHPDRLEMILSPDPVCTLRCPECYTVMTFRARELSTFPLRHATHYPAQRFSPTPIRFGMGAIHNVGDPSMRPAVDGGWVKYEDYKEVVDRVAALDRKLEERSATIREMTAAHARVREDQEKTLKENKDEVMDELKWTVANLRSQLAATHMRVQMRDVRITALEDLLKAPAKNPLYEISPGHYEVKSSLNTPRYPSYWEATIERLSSRNDNLTARLSDLEEARQKEMQGYDDTVGQLAQHKAMLTGRETELFACREHLKLTEKERDVLKEKVHKLREALINGLVHEHFAGK